MWMPGGTHQVSCGEVQADGTVKPVKELVSVGAADGARLNAQLQELAKANARPFLDYDHAGGEASGWPVEIAWQEADIDLPAGIYVRVEWASRGADLIAGKGYRYFSPEWVMDKEGKVQLPQSGPLGGLVNNPAFREMRRIAQQISEISADAGRVDPAGGGPNGDGSGPHNTKESMSKKLIAALIAAGVLKSEAEAADDAVATQVEQRLQARKQAEPAEEETETVKQLRAQMQAMQARAGKTFVAGLVSAGKLPPKDETAAAVWEKAYAKDPDGTEELARSLRAAAALTDLGTGGGAAPVVTGTEADELKLRARGARLQARAVSLYQDGKAGSIDAAWLMAEAEIPE